MDGGLMTSPPPRFTGIRLGGFQQRPPRPDAPYTFNFRAPGPPQGGGQQGCDGKKPRTKVVTRKTVDYNSTVCGYVQSRVWQRDFRDMHALQPDSLYYPLIKPPSDMLEHPMNCVVTKHVRTAANKVRCPVFCVCWTPDGRRLITGASSGEFTLWNGLNFSFETILQAHDTAVRSLVWSHNEQWLLSGDHGGYVKYWQLNMNNVKMYQAHKDPVRGLRFVGGSACEDWKQVLLVFLCLLAISLCLSIQSVMCVWTRPVEKALPSSSQYHDKSTYFYSNMSLKKKTAGNIHRVGS